MSSNDVESLLENTEWNNITKSIANKVGLNIFKQECNPICILKKSILSYFSNTYGNEFSVFEDFSPIVTTKQAFDDILIPKDHVSRRKSDTYYIDATHVLRPHTSAHQVELLKKNIDSFIVVGDVYRRDEVNRTHFPAFTQMEIVRVLKQVCVLVACVAEFSNRGNHRRYEGCGGRPDSFTYRHCGGDIICHCQM